MLIREAIQLHIERFQDVGKPIPETGGTRAETRFEHYTRALPSANIRG